MQKTTLLTVIGKSTPVGSLNATIESAKANDMHLACLVIGEVPRFPTYAYGVPPFGGFEVPEDWQDKLRHEGAALVSQGNEIEALLQREGVSGDVTTVCTEVSMIQQETARRAMVCDLAVICDDLRNVPDVFRNVVYGLLFHAPIGVILNQISLSQPKRMFIAWNTGLPAARAVHQALPLLKGADEVIVASFDPVMSEQRDGQNPGSDLGAWLSHHGCQVTVMQYPTGGKKTSTCIQERCAETGADMVVMGAFGHSRLQQSVFGGTTRVMLDQTKIPVLMAH